jgi:hypothetical protein
MLVDTGGLNMLTPQAARRLGLASEGKMAATGAGAEKVDMAFARGRTLTVGDVELAQPLFYVIEVGPLADVLGEDFDGLVGFELFHRLAVRIDYAQQRLTLSSPADFSAPAGATSVPFEMKGRIPIVRGEIDGLPARFSVDTGARNSITTNAPFTRDHKLVERYRPRFETVTGWGVGGPIRAQPVRLKEVKIGDVRVTDVVGDLFSSDKGAFADRDTSANLGGGILHRFVVTFDYAGHRMFLEPRAKEMREPYDRTGIISMRAGEAMRLVAVTPGSPAERAGLRAGDRIVAIDGAPVASRRLAEWRRSFRVGEVGTQMRFTVERDGQRQDLSVKLAELLP